MVHKVVIKKRTGYIVEIDGEYFLFTSEEYKKAKNRFKSKYSVGDKIGK